MARRRQEQTHTQRRDMDRRGDFPFPAAGGKMKSVLRAAPRWDKVPIQWKNC